MNPAVAAMLVALLGGGAIVMWWAILQKRKNKPSILVEGVNPISGLTEVREFPPGHEVNWQVNKDKTLRLILYDAAPLVDTKTGKRKFTVNLANGLCAVFDAVEKNAYSWGPDRYYSATVDHRGNILTRGIPENKSEWAKIVLWLGLGLVFLVGLIMVVNAVG